MYICRLQNILTLKGPVISILLKLLYDIVKAKISIQISQIETHELRSEARESPPQHYWYLSRVILCSGGVGGLSHALRDIQQHPWPLPPK